MASKRIDFSEIPEAYTRITQYWNEGARLNRASHTHKQVPIQFAGRTADVDEGLVQTLLDLWKLGIETSGSCQGYGDFDFYIEFPRAEDYLKLMDVILKFQPDIRSRAEFDQYCLKGGFQIEFHPVDCPCPFESKITLFVNREKVWLIQGIIHEAARSCLSTS